MSYKSLTIGATFDKIKNMEDIKTIIKEYSEEMKQHNEALKEDFKRYLGVLHEDFGRKNQLLAEAIVGVQSRLDDNTGAISGVQSRLDNNTAAISGVQSRLDAHAEAIAAVKEDTEIIKIDIGFIKNALQKKVDIEQFMVLERRVANLESRVR